MTKQEALVRKAELLKELELVNRIIDSPEVSKEDRFWGLVCGLQMKVDFKKYPYSIFWFNGEECRVEYELKTGNLWLHYPTIWSVFEEYGLSYQQIQAFIKAEVEEHSSRFINFSLLVEEYSKMKGVRPPNCRCYQCRAVEEHLKMKGVRPRHRFMLMICGWKNTSK